MMCFSHFASVEGYSNIEGRSDVKLCFEAFRDIIILVLVILLCYMKIYLINFHMQLKVSKLDFCI